MSQVINDIHREHQNISRLMRLLQAQVDAFKQGGLPDWELVRDALRYLADWPDRYHHPKEDRILAQLKIRAPEFSDAATSIQEQHRELAELTAKFADAVEQVLHDETLERDWFVRIAEEYIEHQIHHMNIEETEFLPAAEEILSSADWSAIDADLEHADDPLFGERAEERFEMLRDMIEAGS